MLVRTFELRNTTYIWKKDDHPDSSALISLSQAMNHAYYLKNDGKQIKVAIGK